MSEFHPIPLIRLFGNLIVPIQVSLSDSQVERLRDDVTLAIEQGRVSGLIVDLSGVDMMDSYITRCIRDLALSARLMGVDTVVCGIPRAVVITLVEMGLGIPGVASALNLDRALERLVSGEPDAPVLTAVRSDHERLA
jgi:rsbT antagonist protein RsbS